MGIILALRYSALYDCSIIWPLNDGMQLRPGCFANGYHRFGGGTPASDAIPRLLWASGFLRIRSESGHLVGFERPFPLCCLWGEAGVDSDGKASPRPPCANASSKA